MGDDEVRVGLLRRIELHAVLRPEANKWFMRGYGFMLIWSMTGFVGAAIAGNETSMAVTALGVLVGGGFLTLALWARHRVPETRIWMDQVEARHRELHPDEP